MSGSSISFTTYQRAATSIFVWPTTLLVGKYYIAGMKLFSVTKILFRRMPFAFLNELQQKFTSSALPSSSSSLSPAYALQGTFGPVIAQLMNTYNTSPPSDELTRAQSELAQVKNIMVQNVEQILSRGERIELLVDKTDNMASQATAFRRGAKTVRRSMWWKNTRVLALSVLVGLVSFFHVCR